MRYAAVYQTKKELIFCSNAQTTDGVNLSIPPYIHLSKNANALDITAAIQKVLASNQFDIPHPKQTEWGGISKRHLEELGVKSLSILHKKASYCSITEDGKVFVFSPTRNAGQEGGYEFMPHMDKLVPIDASPDQIVAVLQETLKISEDGSLSSS